MKIEHCLRCNQDFVMRPGRKTSRCSLCRSRYWNKPRTGKWLRRGATDEERFWHKVKQGLESECWLWTGAVARRSGLFYFTKKGKKRLISAPRFVWFLQTGKHIPPDLFACHHCDNPLCVNPAHIFIGDHADNMRDMMNKGRSCRGEKNKGHRTGKLTAALVCQLRSDRKSGLSITKTAKKYGIATTTVKGIMNGKLWRHV